LSDMMNFYYQTFMVLTNEDPLKMKEVLKLDKDEALQYLSYRVDKARREKKEIEKMKKR